MIFSMLLLHHFFNKYRMQNHFRSSLCNLNITLQCAHMKLLHNEVSPPYRRLISELLYVTPKEQRSYLLLFSLYLLRHPDCSLQCRLHCFTSSISDKLLSYANLDLYGSLLLCGYVCKHIHFLIILLSSSSLVLKTVQFCRLLSDVRSNKTEVLL